MKKSIVGGPLLGHRNRSAGSDIVSWKEFEPLVSPAIVLGGQNKRPPQRFILLPNERFISVLAYKTGVRIATLIPFLNGQEQKETEGGNGGIVIESVCLATYPRKSSQKSVQDVLDKMKIDGDSEEGEDIEEDEVDEVVVLAGCRDGTIREFSLNSLESGLKKKAKSVDCGSYHVPGPCFRPRRVIKVTKEQPIIHLTVPPLGNTAQDNGLLVYALAETKSLEKSEESKQSEKASNVNVSLLRLNLPQYDKSTAITLDSESGKQVVDQLTCRVGKGDFSNTVPFFMGSVVRPTCSGQKADSDAYYADQSVFVVIARTSTIHVYYEQLQSPSEVRRFPSMAFTMPPNNPVSAIRIPANNSDITCGHGSGEIRVMNNLLTIVEDYHMVMAKHELHFGSEETKSADKPEHPTKTFVTTKVHWHAHPVTSLAYDAASSVVDPLLYSGGEESVLVTWQLSRGTYKPADVLPRLALGGIVHIVCAGNSDDDVPNGILVYCEDNSLQLFESHNKTKLWKVQGLAARQSRGRETFGTYIEADPRAHGSSDPQLILTGLPDAPGVIHWYNPRNHKVSASLEAAPFNRVSRTEQGESPMPAPAIVNHAFSANGNDLITVDEAATENAAIGAYEKRENGMKHGIVTTVRFWSWNSDSTLEEEGESKVPYNLTAAMTYPHGPKHRVSGMCISKDGNHACTVSDDEKAFRVWRKAASQEEDEVTNSQIPAWTCRYKVTIPAGFSNFSCRRDGVAFSEDASILAICFGNMITLWDNDEVRFLTSLRHLEGDPATIDSVKFVNTTRSQDLLLTKSSAGITLQSPFGDQGGFQSWSWGIPEGVQGMLVSDVEMIESHESVGISIFDQYSGQSRVVFIDAATGMPGIKGEDSNSTAAIDGIEGRIRSIGAVGRLQKVTSGWSDESKTNKNPIRVYTLTSRGELLLFQSDEDETATRSEWMDVTSVSNGPKLDLPNRSSDGRKRHRPGTEVPSAALEASNPTMAVEIFGGSSGPPSSSDLPALSGAFVRAFVGRNLSRR
jgi:hypothetical protein